MLRKFSILVATAYAAGGNYDYKKHGADWPNAFPDCGKAQQSPIDLKSSWGLESAMDDGFNKLYNNI